VRNGLKLCRELRRAGQRMPIPDAGRRGDAVEDRISGLIMAADDYLTKPFEFRELLCAAAGAAAAAPENYGGTARISVADLVLDTGAQSFRGRVGLFPVTTKEYALLEFSGAQNAGAWWAERKIA